MELGSDWRCAAESGRSAPRPFRRAPRSRHRGWPGWRRPSAGSRSARDIAARRHGRCANQPHGFVFDEADGAHAVPLDLEEPLVAARRSARPGPLSWADGRRHGGLSRRPLQRTPGWRLGLFAFWRRGAARILRRLWMRPRRPALPFALRIAGRLALGLARRQIARSPPACGRRARCRRALDVPPGHGIASRFLMISHSLPLPRPFMWTRRNRPSAFRRAAGTSDRRARSAPDRRVAQQRPRCRDPTASRCPRRNCRPEWCPRIRRIRGVIFHVRGQMFERGIERGPLGTAHDFSTPSISRRKS
jgi:hypothetical protein